MTSTGIPETKNPQTGFPETGNVGKTDGKTDAGETGTGETGTGETRTGETGTGPASTETGDTRQNPLAFPDPRLECGPVVKRSVRIAGHPTSVSLESAFWEALQEIANSQGLSLNQLITGIDSWRLDHGGGNLSGSLRVYALSWFRRPNQLPDPASP